MTYRPAWWDSWCREENPQPDPDKLAEAVCRAMNANPHLLDAEATSCISHEGIVMIGALPPFAPKLVEAVENSRHVN